MRTKLHGPLDGLAKAWYDDDKAVLTIRYGDTVATYDEDECDRLLRLMEYAVDPLGDLAEFFNDTDFAHFGGRVAEFFMGIAWQLETKVYA